MCTGLVPWLGQSTNATSAPLRFPPTTDSSLPHSHSGLLSPSPWLQPASFQGKWGFLCIQRYHLESGPNFMVLAGWACLELQPQPRLQHFSLDLLSSPAAGSPGPPLLSLSWVNLYPPPPFRQGRFFLPSTYIWVTSKSLLIFSFSARNYEWMEEFRCYLAQLPYMIWGML